MISNSLNVKTSSLSSVGEAPQLPQNHGMKHAVCNTLFSIINPIFSAIQSQWARLNKKAQIKNSTFTIYKDIQQALLEEQEKLLSYLDHPEIAPADWINASININGTFLSPLHLIACAPKMALESDTDPFFQLLERGANPDKGIYAALELVCALATRDDCTPEDNAVHIARAKKLILAEASLPKYRLGQAWLHFYCRDELQAIASQPEPENHSAAIDTRLPPGWTPPQWFPPLEELSEPILQSKPSNSINTSTRWISKQREKWRPLREAINQQYPLLPVGSLICLFGLSMASIAGRLNDIALTVLTALLITPAVIDLATPLNQRDMQRLFKKALQNPLYAELWQKAQSNHPVKLSFQPLGVFLRPGLTKDQVSLAHFNSNRNAINIYQGGTEERAFDQLIFETANAYQSSRFNAICNKFFQGHLEREEFVRLIEYTEWDTRGLSQQIMDFGHEHLGWENNCRQAQILLKNWEIAWENKNVRSHPHTPDAHADHYRAQWDQLAFLYYLRHPEKAPASDWINETPSTLPPLTLLARRPDIALLWEQDPFFELIDKGAEINSDLLKVVISSATAPSRTDEEQKVQASRARNLLKAGVECPSGLSDQEKAWLQSIKS